MGVKGVQVKRKSQEEMERMEGWEQRDFVAHKPYGREELCCESIASGHLKPSELQST